MTLSHSIAALILPQQTTARMSWPPPLSSFFMTNTPRSHIALLLQSPFQRVMSANANTHAPLHSPPSGPISLSTGAPWFLTCTTQTSPRSFSSSSINQPKDDQCVKSCPRLQRHENSYSLLLSSTTEAGSQAL